MVLQFTPAHTQLLAPVPITDTRRQTGTNRIKHELGRVDVLGQCAP